MELFKQEMEFFWDSSEVVTSQEMILGFGILSIAHFKP